MKRISLLIAFFALLFIVLPSLTAQDEKKKDPDKKDEAKKADDPEKKKDKDEPKKEKLIHGAVYYGKKVLSVNTAGGREFTVEMREVDQKKVTDVQTWQAQRMQQLGQQAGQIMQQYNQALTKTNPNDRANALANVAKSQANYQNDVAKFQIELAKKDVTSAKPWDVRAHEEIKVRALTPPVEFDDLGFEKKWTKKELEERKDKTGLPGFPVEFDQVKSGQYVDIYMAKTAKDKDQPKKKKGPDDDPAVPDVKTVPEVVMIVIRQQPAPPK